jgi:peroxiredoxin
MTPLQVGDRVQDFTLPSSTGEAITLSVSLRSGPAVLAWYPFDFGRI